MAINILNYGEFVFGIDNFERKKMRFSSLMLAILLFCSCDQNKVISEKTTENKEIILPKESATENNSNIRFYLTFDDGPYTTTPRLLSQLESLQVRSNFFIVGSQVEYSTAYDSTFNNVKKSPYCKIYNHSYSHAVTHGRIGHYYSNPENVYEDIKRNKSIINTGGNISRLPGLNTWRIGDNKIRISERAEKLMQYLDSNKIRENIIGWDVEWKAKHSRDKNQVDSLFETIRKLATSKNTEVKNIVLLSHDYLYKDEQSLKNLAYLIERLKKDLNCSFKWVEEMDGLYSE